MPSFSRWNRLDLPFICSFEESYYMGILDQTERHTRVPNQLLELFCSVFWGLVVLQVLTIFRTDFLVYLWPKIRVWNSGWIPWRWLDSDSRQLRIQTDVTSSSSRVLPLQSPINKVSLSGPLLTSWWEEPDVFVWVCTRISNVSKYISLNLSAEPLFRNKKCVGPNWYILTEFIWGAVKYRLFC